MTTPRLLPKGVLVAATAAGLIAIAGCASITAESPANPTAAKPSPSPSAPSASAAPPAASPSPAASAAAMPQTCEELLPVAILSDTLGEAWVDSGEPLDPGTTLPGPAARSAAQVAQDELSCRWWPGLASEGLLLGYAFRSDAASREVFIDALGDAGSFTPLTLAGSDAAFSASEVRGDLRYTVVYAFVEDVWVALEGPLTTDALTTLAATVVSPIAAHD